MFISKAELILPRQSWEDSNNVETEGVQVWDLVWFYDLSIIVGYPVPNPFLYK